MSVEENTSMSMTEFLKKHGITMTAARTNSNPNFYAKDMWIQSSTHWFCLFSMGDSSFQTFFSQGSGHRGKAPLAKDVMNCLISDSSSVQGRSFEDWASDMGYDTDSRKAERTYDIIVRQSKNLKLFLGKETLSEALHKVERE